MGVTDLQRDAAERRAEAEAVRAEADARAAVAAADRATRENAEATTAGARALRAAEERKAAAEARESESAARQRAVAGLVPDFSRVDRGSLDVGREGPPLFSSALAYRALEHAADQVVERISANRPDLATARVLITSDVELAASDAAYGDVVAGLDELTAVAERVLDAVTTPATAGPDGDGKHRRIGGFEALLALPVAAAVATALPGVLSLLSSRRTVLTAALTTSDVATAAAVAGALRREHEAAIVVHDDIRLVPRGVVHERLAALSELRRRLAESRLSIEAADPADDEARAEAARKIAMLDATIEAIETFATAIRTIPENGSRSPLTQAALREQLHEGDFTHLLFVQAGSGSAQQATDDKWLAKDKFSIIATAAVTFMLLDPDTSHVLISGTAGGSASLHGKIGAQLPDPYRG